METTARIFVAGHRGLAGSAIARKLLARGYTDLLLRTRPELDLLDRGAAFEAVLVCWLTARWPSG